MNLYQRLEKKFWRFPLTSYILAQYGAAIYRTAYKANLLLKIIPVPRSVHILLTKRCNSRCRHCEASAGEENPRELNSNEIMKVLRRMSELKTTRVIFTGGEALLRDDIFELIAAAKELGLLVTLATNGLMVSDHKEKLRETLPDAIFTSIDGLDEMHEQVRGVKGSFKRTIESIGILREVGVKDIMVNTVITDSNIDTLDQLGQKIFQAGASFWRLSPAMPVGRAKGKGDFILAQGSVRRLIDFVANSQFSERMDINEECGGLGLLDRKLRTHPFFCGAGYKICAIMSTGEVVPCHVVYNEESSVGNVRNEDFAVLWNRCRDTVQQTPFPSACRKCAIYRACLGGCWAMRYNNNECLRTRMEF